MTNYQEMNRRVTELAGWIIQHPSYFSFTDDQMTKLADNYMSTYIATVFDMMQYEVTPQQVEEFLKVPSGNETSEILEKIFSPAMESPNAHIACAKISSQVCEKMLEVIKPEHAKEALTFMETRGMTPQLFDMIEDEYAKAFPTEE